MDKAALIKVRPANRSWSYRGMPATGNRGGYHELAAKIVPGQFGTLLPRSGGTLTIEWLYYVARTHAKRTVCKG